MMKSRVLALFFAVITICNLHGQEEGILVEYLTTYNTGNTSKNKLKIVGKQSLYGNDVDNVVMKNDKAYQFEKSDKKLSVVINKPRLVYKNFKDDKMISTERIVLDIFNVKDSVKSIMNWKIFDEEKEILGYKCKKAATHFRGRDYVAYFTNDIKEQNGPWKFSGLPGLILEVYSTDNYIKFTAVEIKFLDSQKLENPFADEKIDFYTYNDFKKEYQKEYDKAKKGKIREDGKLMTTEIPKGNMEIYVE